MYDNAYLIVWGAHAQAYWDVFYDGVRTIQLKGRRVTVCCMDHPEWIGLRDPSERLKDAIQTLKTIGRVHGVTVSTVELEAELERRIQSWTDHEAEFQEARAKDQETRGERSFSSDKAVADEARWIRHEAKVAQVHDRDDDVRWTRHGAEATPNARSVNQIKDVRQLGFVLIRAGYTVHQTLISTTLKPWKIGALDASSSQPLVPSQFGYSNDDNYDANWSSPNPTRTTFYAGYHNVPHSNAHATTLPNSGLTMETIKKLKLHQ